MTSRKPVVDYLPEDIQKQTYKKDERLPSEHELAQHFELTRVEVRKAYNCLKEMGYVYSRQRKDNYYAEYLEKVEPVLSSTDSSSMKTSLLAGRFSTHLLSCKRTTWRKDIHERLVVVQGEPVLCMKRLRYLDHMPAAMHIPYMREKGFPNIRECPQESPSLYTCFQSRDIQGIAVEGTQLTVSTLSTEEYLYVKASGIVPCLTLKGVSRDCETKEILELPTIIYRGDKFVFRL